MYESLFYIAIFPINFYLVAHHKLIKKLPLKMWIFQQVIQ